MNCSPTISANDFKSIHNALYDLDVVCEHLEDVLKPELYLKLAKVRNTIRESLADAYLQDDTAFTRKSKHYDQVKEQLGIQFSEWSLYEVDNLNDRHPFEGATRLVYRDHWGAGPVERQINGSTWTALWLAANACIRDSGDEHHVFIEQFKVSDEDPSLLVMQTGS